MGSYDYTKWNMFNPNIMNRVSKICVINPRSFFVESIDDVFDFDGPAFLRRLSGEAGIISKEDIKKCYDNGQFFGSPDLMVIFPSNWSFHYIVNNLTGQSDKKIIAPDLFIAQMLLEVDRGVYKKVHSIPHKYNGTSGNNFKSYTFKDLPSESVGWKDQWVKTLSNLKQEDYLARGLLN
jgi:hypothetical protein